MRVDKIGSRIAFSFKDRESGVAKRCITGDGKDGRVKELIDARDHRAKVEQVLFLPPEDVGTHEFGIIDVTAL